MVSESDTDTVFLRPFLNILLSEFLIYMFIHTKFLLSPGEPSPTHGAERDIQIQKERMPTSVDILLLFR